MKTRLNMPAGPVKGVVLIMTALIMTASFIHLPARSQWNPNTAVNLLIANLPVADMQQVATSDGKTWIAFYHQNAGNYDMRAQLIDADGYKLLGDDGILVSNKPSGTATYVFNVCVDASDNLIIGFQYQGLSDMQAVLHKISQTGIQLWGGNGIVIGNGLVPWPCTLSNGETAVVWNESASNTLNLQKITTAGATAWATPVPITVGSAKTTRGQIVANTGGKFTVVYQKQGGGISTTLFAQMFDNNGTALYVPLQLSSETTSGARYYSIAAEADTTYFGYYSSVGLRFNSWLQRINPSGSIPWGMNGSHFNTATASGDNYQGTTNINLTQGSPYVWSVCTFSNPNQTQYGIYVQKFLKSTGARQLTDYGKVVYPVSNSSDQHAGELALVDDGPMFMSYISNNKIYATRLDGSGNFVWPGNRVEISSTTTAKGRFGFTPVGPDRCAGTWAENRGEGFRGYAQGISVGGLVGLTVETQGGVPATITVNGGTLQMVATVFPSTANQSVTWSMISGSGMATITQTGLVTAISNGTAWAKAVSVQDPTVTDSLMITMTNQTAAAPTVITEPATAITSSSATLNGTVNANSLITSVTFEWGLTTAYGNVIVADPPSVMGSVATPVQAQISGLSSNTTYHFRVVGSNAVGLSNGEDLSFTTEAGVGLPDGNEGRITLYPVPNAGRFIIRTSGTLAGRYDISVFNGFGRLVYRSEDRWLDRDQEEVVDLGTTAAGVYAIVLENCSERWVKKFQVGK
jgi:hypothetical protein